MGDRPPNLPVLRTWCYSFGSAAARGRRFAVSALDWVLSITLLTIYISCLFTVCSLTFQKGYTLLGIGGIFIPILWLVGAILPAKEGSRYAIREATARQYQAQQLSR